jgi:EF hand domain-containing protein
MLLALGAVSSVWDALQSLTSSSKTSSVQTASPGQTASSLFDIDASAPAGGASGTGTSRGVQISPQTMSALIAAQSQSGTTNPAPTDPSQALQDLFSQIDGNGDGGITKQEFESALGAGGTNIAAADDVFNKLDTNGDGSVSLDELKQALQGAGHHGGHHHVHAGGTGDGDGTDPTSSSDPLLAALAGASSTSVANTDGSTTTSITYADGSKVSLTSPAASTSSTSSASSSATSSYNLIEQLIQREAQALSASISGAVSVSA